MGRDIVQAQNFNDDMVLKEILVQVLDTLGVNRPEEELVEVGQVIIDLVAQRLDNKRQAQFLASRNHMTVICLVPIDFEVRYDFARYDLLFNTPKLFNPNPSTSNLF